MQLTTVRIDGGTRAGVVEGDEIALLDAVSVDELLTHDDWRNGPGASAERIPFSGADFAPVVTAPSKVICVGLNYRSHIEEMGNTLPDHPTLFTKFASTLIGAADPITVPAAGADRIDWEAELAFVIGAPIRLAGPDEAAAAIAGFTVANDVSMRDWQRATSQFLAGKAWDRTTPVGPVLVTPDDVGGPRPDLAISCRVDGDVRQDSHTGDLLFDPPTVASYISTFTELVPGDLVLTGTPGGVGAGRTPPHFLADGEVVETRIDGIGTLTNQVRVVHRSLPKRPIHT